MGVFEFCKNVLALDSSEIITITIENINEKKAIELNQSQLIKGYDSNGKEMPKYTKKTKQIKAETGGFLSPSGRIALKDTGDFFNEMRIDKKDDFFAITSEDEKRTMLQNRYGKDVLGLNDKDQNTIIEETRKPTIKEIENRLYK